MKEINGLRVLGVGGVGGAVLEPVLPICFTLR